MSRKIYAAIIALTLTLTALGASLNRWGRTEAVAASNSSATELLAMLPASDAVAFVDAQRMLSEVMPHIFVNDSATLARVNKEIDKFRDHTGTDARQFDSIAVGVRFRKGGAASPDVVTGLVRGRFSASEVIAAGLAKAKATRKVQPQEEQHDGVTIYNVEGTNPRGLRLAALDSTTVVFGDAEGVRAALDVRAGRGARVDSSLVELATMNATAVAGFAANVPPDAAQKMIGAKDDLGRLLSSIRQIYGSADATTTTGALTVTLRTETGEQAQELAEKLVGFKQLASLYAAQSSQPQTGAQTGAVLSAGDDKTLAITRRGLPFPSKWIKDVEIKAEGADVKLRLEEPLNEIAPFLRIF